MEYVRCCSKPSSTKQITVSRILFLHISVSHHLTHIYTYTIECVSFAAPLFVVCFPMLNENRKRKTIYMVVRRAWLLTLTHKHTLPVALSAVYCTAQRVVMPQVFCFFCVLPYCSRNPWNDIWRHVYCAPQFVRIEKYVSAWAAAAGAPKKKLYQQRRRSTSVEYPQQQHKKKHHYTAPLPVTVMACIARRPNETLHGWWKNNIKQVWEDTRASSFVTANEHESARARVTHGTLRWPSEMWCFTQTESAI